MSGEYWTSNEGSRNKYGNLLQSLVITRTVLQQAIAVGATAVKLPTTPIQARHSLLIQNSGSNAIYLGDSSVTTADGYPIYPRGQILIQIEDTVDLYAIASAAGESVRILEGA